MQYECSINFTVWISYWAMQDSRFWQWCFWSFKPPWCDPELFSKWLPTFWSIQAVPMSELFLKCLTLKTTASESFKTSETTYPITHHHIPEDLKLHVTVQQNSVEILYHNGNYQSGPLNHLNLGLLGVWTPSIISVSPKFQYFRKWIWYCSQLTCEEQATQFCTL